MNRTVICLALISIAFGAGCYTWQCGTITAADSCLHLDGTSVIVQPCPSGQKCSVNVGASTVPQDVINELLKGDIKCIDKPKPTNRTTQLPGDFCRYNYNCLSEKCETNRCAAKVALGGTCKTTSECDVGQFCGGDLKCTAIKKPNDACTKSEECGFLSDCFTDPKTKTSKCIEWGSLPIGTKISDSTEFTSYRICSTFYSVTVNKDTPEDGAYCMPAPQSASGIEEGQASALYCNYDEYINPANPSEKTSSINPPPLGQCGFNIDPLFYCPV